MKIVFFYPQTSKESWQENALGLYVGKIKPFIDFQLSPCKVKPTDRKHRESKIKMESQVFLEKLKQDDLIWAFDEGGELPGDSLEFSKLLERALGSGKKRLSLVMGGAYGLDTKVKEKAQKIISLSRLTMNHRVAQIVIMEQLYRALTIRANIAYHN